MKKPIPLINADEVMQNMRLCKLATIRTRLQILLVKDPMAYAVVAKLFTPSPNVP